MTRSKLRQRLLYLVVSLPVAAMSQNASRLAPIPRDPLELASGQIQEADTKAQRDVALQLLTRARNSYALRNLRQPWDLKVHFTVNSLGATNYDGDWDMEDIFSPGQGLHWTAKSAAGFAITGIFGLRDTYAEATSSVIPLRLQETRSMLYNPLPSVSYAGAGSIRTAAARLRGSQVTCILLSRSRDVSNSTARQWDESEDCIDSQTGLLQLHSETPGRYALYDYSNAVQLGTHGLPGKVTVTEGGRAVSTISVTSLQPLSSADPELFIPTDAMKAAPAVAMTASTKIARIQAEGSSARGGTLHPVCIFGLVTPEGHLIEAHSLQPADPNSDAALKDAQTIDFSPSMRGARTPQQHFVFVIEEFAAPQ